MEIGSTAPNFQTEDVWGNKINLENYIGNRVYLTFLRNVDCVFCNLQVNNLIRKKADFEKNNISVIIVLQSPKEDILETFIESNTSFPYKIIPDPKKVLYNQYKVRSSFFNYMKFITKMGSVMKAKKKGYKVTLKQRGEQFLMPADFIIGPTGEFLKIHYGSDVADHLTIDEIIN